MKTIRLLIAPDYSPEVYIDWRILTYALQAELNMDIVLLTPENHDKFHEIMVEKRPEIIYSNPFDVIGLTEIWGYQSMVKPVNKSDEILLFSSVYGNIKNLTDIQKPLLITSLPSKESMVVSQLLLEAFGINSDDIEWDLVNHLPSIMRKVGSLDAPVGAIYADYFYGLSLSRQSDYRVLIESKLEVMHHVFMVRGNENLKTDIQQVLLRLSYEPRYRRVFKNLGWHHGLTKIDDDESLFFLDILRALNQN